MEFKEQQRLTKHSIPKVDIATEWNLKIAESTVFVSDIAVDIATEWNLKHRFRRTSATDLRRYSNRMEFKVS